MNQIARKILFWSFVGLFFILSALILPYAFGYQVNLSGLKFQRTGMFDIKTKPAGALIYLNNKTVDSVWSKLTGQVSAAVTPAKIKNLAPGTYQVRLELKGYHAWEKRLSIKPSETTYLEDVYFFKNKEASFLSGATKPLTASLAPDSKYLAVLADNELRLFDWQGEIKKIPLKNSGTFISWSPDSQKIMTSAGLYDIKNDKLISAIDLSLAPIEQARWADDNLFYFLSKRQLFSYNLKNSAQSAGYRSAMAITDFYFKDNELYVASANKLIIVKASDASELKTITLKSGDYRFWPESDGRLQIYDERGHKLYLLTNKFPWQDNYEAREIGPLTKGVWANKDLLLMANDFELATRNPADDNNKLLTRLSSPLGDLTMHPSKNYIIFTTAKTISSLELDDRDQYNIINLLSANDIRSVIFNSEVNKIFFWADLNNQKGFYFLEI